MEEKSHIPELTRRIFQNRKGFVKYLKLRAISQKVIVFRSISLKLFSLTHAVVRKCILDIYKKRFEVGYLFFLITPRH